MLFTVAFMACKGCSMDHPNLRKSFRNAWMLIILSLVFIVSFFLFTLRLNEPGREARWDMGGESFVPASSVYGEGYYLPVDEWRDKNAISP